jgi:hypothetical protein
LSQQSFLIFSILFNRLFIDDKKEWYVEMRGHQMVSFA